MLIDTHAHLNFNAYKDDGHEVIRRALDKNIWLINVGSQNTTSTRAVKIANQYEKGIYAAIGLHPIHLSETEVDEEEIKFQSREEKFTENKYQELLDNNKKIVAVGEIGLDYFHLPKSATLAEIKKNQKQEFIKQLQFAAKNNLPVILHCRGSKKNPSDAYQDLINILKIQTTRYSLQTINYKLQTNGVIHCFGGSLEIAEQFIKLGFYLGFTGIITYKNAESVSDIAKQAPLEKILVETDCPYLSPDPHRGERNEPAFVEYVARKIAIIKNISFEKVADATTQNAKKLFGIDDL